MDKKNSINKSLELYGGKPAKKSVLQENQERQKLGGKLNEKRKK
jgi:hypothetical protein